MTLRWAGRPRQPQWPGFGASDDLLWPEDHSWVTSQISKMETSESFHQSESVISKTMVMMTKKGLNIYGLIINFYALT